MGCLKLGIAKHHQEMLPSVGSVQWIFWGNLRQILEFIRSKSFLALRDSSVQCSYACHLKNSGPTIARHGCLKTSCHYLPFMSIWHSSQTKFFWELPFPPCILPKWGILIYIYIIIHLTWLLQKTHLAGVDEIWIHLRTRELRYPTNGKPETHLPNCLWIC